MESVMLSSDIVAQENDSWDHFNTGAEFSATYDTDTELALALSGWIWFRRHPKTVDAWREVLAMDMKETSRDQNNFNTVGLLFAQSTSFVARG